MPLPLKICLTNIGIALFFSMLFSLSDRYFVDAVLNWFGPVAIVGGVVDAVIALFFFAFRKDQIGYGFLLSAGALLLLGFFSNKIF